MADIIQIRRDTATNWEAANPILAQGEPAMEIDTKKEKIGDGTTAWNSLPYRLGSNPGLATKESFTATASQTDFVLSNIPSNVEVYKDRVYQLETIDYDLSGDTVTFTAGVLENSIVTIRKF